MSETPIPIPPRELRFMAEDESRFLELGDSLVGRLGDVTPLAQANAVLDVGCGYGRIAHALLRREEFAGAYVGFDSLARQIAWCRANLTDVSGDRFRFVHLDVRNERSNRQGQLAPEQIRFPVADGWSELTVLTSVFTQMYPDALRRYLEEVARTLSPNGVAYATAFVIDKHFRSGAGLLAVEDVLPYRLRGYCRYGDATDPLRRIAYDQQWLTWAAEDVGLALSGLQLGTWRRKGDGRGTQDSFLLARADGHAAEIVGAAPAAEVAATPAAKPAGKPADKLAAPPAARSAAAGAAKPAGSEAAKPGGPGAAKPATTAAKPAGPGGNGDGPPAAA